MITREEAWDIANKVSGNRDEHKLQLEFVEKLITEAAIAGKYIIHTDAELHYTVILELKSRNFHIRKTNLKVISIGWYDIFVNVPYWSKP